MPRAPEIPPPPRIVGFAAEHLDDVIGLLAAEGWSHADDPQRTWRALTAPGSTSIVALVDDDLVGVAQVLSDGEIQSFLALLAVRRSHRRRGVGRMLIDCAFERAGGRRLDLISCADPFYEALGYRRLPAFRTQRSIE